MSIITIPDSRKVEWKRGVNTGVPGGMFQYLDGSGHANERSNASGINLGVVHSLDNTGATSVSSALEASLATLGSGQAGYLPLGVYRMEGGLTMTKDFTTLRGITSRKWITSSTSITLGVGEKTFVIGEGHGYTAGIGVRVWRHTVAQTYMQGTVVSYTGGSLTINVTKTGGTAGTYSDWKVSTVYLEFVGGGSVFLGGTPDYAWDYPNVTVVADSLTGLMPAKGDTAITVSSTTGFSVGQLVCLKLAGQYDVDQMIAGATPVIHTAGFPYLQAHMARVLSIVGTKITLDTPLHYDHPLDRQPRLARATQVYEGIGMEGMTMGFIEGTAGFCLSMGQGSGSWFYEIEVHAASNRNISLRYCHRSEVRQCWAWGRKVVGGTNGVAMYFNQSTACLVESNVIGDNFPGIQVVGGSTGNAITFNYLDDGYGTNGGSSRINLNHGPHNSFNLVEGNIAPHVMSDGYFGSASDDTIFRNFLYGTNVSTGSAGWVVQCRFTRNYNNHANIMGDPGIANGVFSFGNPYFAGASGNGLYVSALGGNPHPGLQAWGTITNRISDYEIEVTFDSPEVTPAKTREQDGALYWPDNKYGTVVGSTNYWVTHVAGQVARFANDGTAYDGQTANSRNGSISTGVFPAEGTRVRYFASAEGFPEFDSDVEGTSDEQGNTLVTGTSYAQQSVGADTFPISYVGDDTAPVWWTEGLEYPIKPEDPKMADDGVRFSRLQNPAALEYWRVEELAVPTVATPEFSPAASIYDAAQSVTITCSTPDTTIYYTTDGSIPTTSSTAYSVPVVISSSTTLKAIASDGVDLSSVRTGTYTLQASVPILSVAAGTYGSAQTVNFNSSTYGVTFRYTTNGDTPSSSNGTVGTSVVISSTTTLKVVAYMTGLETSSVISADYIISSSPPPSGSGTLTLSGAFNVGVLNFP